MEDLIQIHLIAEGCMNHHLPYSSRPFVVHVFQLVNFCHGNTHNRDSIQNVCHGDEDGVWILTPHHEAWKQSWSLQPLSTESRLLTGGFPIGEDGG